MSAREGTRRRRISVLHMLGTWEGKIEGCNCPKCKECPGKGKPEVAGKSPAKSPKGPKSVLKKVSPKSKVTDSEIPQEENNAKNTVKKVPSGTEVCDSEFTSDSASDEKLNAKNSDKDSEAMQQASGDSNADAVQKTVLHSVGKESETLDTKTTKKQPQKRQNIASSENSTMKVKSQSEVEGGTSKLVASPRKNTTEEGEDPDDQVPHLKQRRISADEEALLVDPIMVKEEPEEYLSDLDDSEKPTRGRYSDKGKGDRSSRRARMVTSEMENIYAKPRMIFTGKGVVRKFEPGVDRTPKSKRGRKPGKALLPVNVKQEPKELEMVKQEVEGTDLDELQKALTEAAENISGMGEVLLDAFQEFGEGAKKVKQKKKPTSFFKRLEGKGEKYVECNICFKVLKESSMKQHYKTHTGEKPHMCDICHSRFTRKGDVERHKRLVHKSQKPFKCLKCTKEFSDRKNLKAHLQNHDKAIYYGCSTCGFKFGKREYYENHIRYIHPPPDGTLPSFSSVDDDLASKQLKQLEMEEQKERMTQKNLIRSRVSDLEELEEDDDEGDDDDDDDDDDDELDDDEDEDDDDDDKAIEITVTNMDEPKLFNKSAVLVKKDDKEGTVEGISTSSQEEDNEKEESYTVTSTPSTVRPKSEIPPGSSLEQLIKNIPQPARAGTNMTVSKGMLSLTQTISDNDSQDEDLVNKVIAAAVSQATDTIESLQAKSGANMSGNEIEFGDEEETEEEERLDGPDDLQDILGGPSYEMLPIPNMQKSSQQPAEIHITASVSGQQRKFIIQIPPGTNLNVQTPEGMEMIVNIVNQLCAGKGELDGPIEVVMNTPSNRLMFVNNKR